MQKSVKQSMTAKLNLLVSDKEIVEASKIWIMTSVPYTHLKEYLSRAPDQTNRRALKREETELISVRYSSLLRTSIDSPRFLYVSTI